MAARQYETLNAVRGLAAIAVVALHTVPVSVWWRPVAAYRAVDVFFILSGFVLAHAYDNKFAAKMTFRQFMAIRLIRLWPLYALGVAMSVLVLVAGTRVGMHLAWPSFAALFAAGALALIWLPTPTALSASSALYPMNYAFWSLAFELAVNALFAAIWRLLTPRVLAAIVGLSAVLLAVIAYAHRSLDVGPLWSDVAYGVPRTTFSFFMGVLIYRTNFRIPTVLAPWLLLLLPVLFWFTGGPWSALVDLASILVVFPLLLGIWSAHEPARWARIADFLGKTSYAIYITHGPIGFAMGGVLKYLKMNPADHALALLGVLMAALPAWCWAVDKYLDTPLRRRLMALFGLSTRAAPALATAS